MCPDGASLVFAAFSQQRRIVLVLDIKENIGSLPHWIAASESAGGLASHLQAKPLYYWPREPQILPKPRPASQVGRRYSLP